MSKTLYPNSIRIGLMDPSIAQTWAQRILSDGTTVGSIKKGDTINHTTSQPIATGLFCQRIFGPCTDYTCACGHEKIRVGFNPNISPPVCPECHVEWTQASVRRQFLGSIELISPVTHKWFSDSRGAYIPTLLGITPRTFRNLKECKSFFPFGLRQNQELTQVPYHSTTTNSKKKNAKASFHFHLMPKEVANNLRAMHSLELLIDPKKKKVKIHFIQNLQFRNNFHFWFFSNKFLEFGKCLSSRSLEKKLDKADATILAAGATGFPKTGFTSLVYDLSNKYSITTQTLQKSLFFSYAKSKGQYFHNFTDKVIYSNLQTKKNKRKLDKNFFSLIATVPWLTKSIEQAFSVKEKKNLLLKHAWPKDQEREKLNPTQLPLILFGKQKTKTDKDLASLDLQQNLISSYVSNICNFYEIKSLTTIASQIPLVSNKIKNSSFLGEYPDYTIFDWRAKQLLSETKIKQKTIPRHNLLQKKVFLKKENLKYVFLLAERIEEKSFSKSFSTLVLENNQVSSKEFQSKNMLDNKEKLTPLTSLFEKEKTTSQKDKKKMLLNQVRSSLGQNETYIFRDFTKYKFKKKAKSLTLFGKKEKPGLLFSLLVMSSKKKNSKHSVLGLGAKSTKKNVKTKTISNYKIGLLANSKVGLYRIDSPFTFNFLLPQDRTWSIAERIFKGKKAQTFGSSVLALIKGPLKGSWSMQNKSPGHHESKTSEWLLPTDKETIFSHFQCSYLLRTTTSKLWYLKQKETLANFVLKVHFAKFRTIAGLSRETSAKQNKKKLALDFAKKPLNNAFWIKFDCFFTKPPSLINLFVRGKNSLKNKEKEQKKESLKKLTGFTKHHNLPIRPSFTQPEDFRRQFIKFFNANSLIHTKDVPIFCYINKSELSNKRQKKEKTVLQGFQLSGPGRSAPFTQKYKANLLSPEAVEVYFSEAKSYAKEQKIKKILSQTGGGGLQTYLELINLSELVLILQNDLSEIAPRLSRSQFTRRVLLSILNDAKKSKDIKKEYKAVKKICSDFQNRKNCHKRRYKLAFQLLRTMSNPAGMTMSSVPVLPPGLRPIIDVPKIGPITADLNIRYRSLLFALRNLRELAYVDFRNAGAAQASVQEAVDDLLYTGGKTRREKSSSQNPNLYKSLAMRLKGKHGRFRGNLLGKRVDYSGRSVIVVGPTLKLHQCGLPFEIAIKLFNPFLIRSLIQRGFCKNVYKAKQILIRGKFKPLIWTLCQEVMSEHLVLLNRAPTLHRLGVQAFMPVLVSGRAILLHPLVCTGFNADFDGDQMGVHVPLFPQARAEAWKMMWSRNNFLLPSSGEPVLLPSQDMVLGCYYLTCLTPSLETKIKKKKDSNSWKSMSLCFAVMPSKFETKALGSTWPTSPLIDPEPGQDPENKVKTKSFNSPARVVPFTILNTKAALDNYGKGAYSIQSIVWINLNKITYLNYGTKFQRYQKKKRPGLCVSKAQGPPPWNQEIRGLEGEGLATPTLELRVTPFGIMRLLHRGGIQSFTFQNLLLLPGRQTVKPPVFDIFIRTTVGRLIFNNLLENIETKSKEPLHNFR